MNELNKIQFDILTLIKENLSIKKHMIPSILLIEEERINREYEFLEDNGYILENVITKKGELYLEDYKIDNAIILAAGMSTRFVPLNFEKPKALLTVKGEVLIERQIKQLKEKGIHQIIIVVGYMKEKFEYLVNKYGVILIENEDYRIRNNHSSVYVAREFLKRTIITSSDLYFTKNIFQKYAYDSYYTSIYVSGKTAERGVILDENDKILKTMYGDKCYNIWITLGYAVFSKEFSKNFIDILEHIYEKPETFNMFWADIQDEYLSDLYMYIKRCENNIIYEFDSLEELRVFDNKYMYDSNCNIMQEICYLLAVNEYDIVNIESLKQLKNTMFKFSCKNSIYICDIRPDDIDKFSYLGNTYYQIGDCSKDGIKLYKMNNNKDFGGNKKLDINKEINELYKYTVDFKEYHKKSLPLCAAENVISPFANIPLILGFQERYIMNNTYSFNMNDNFIGCEKLFPFYQKISEVCERIFGAKYIDPRPFTGMNCIDMIVKTVCKSGEKMMILSKEHGGHASVKPVVERLGIITYEAPYDLSKNDLDYDQLNKIVKKENIKYVLLAPSDLIKPLEIEKINTDNCVLLWDCSQLMGLIAAGLCDNPLKTMKNIIMFGGTHKTFPGPASGIIMTNEKYLHDLMENAINPKFLRHSQMHQKISLLFALIEFEYFGLEYMSHMIHCSNYLGRKLKEYGLDIAEIDGKISKTHQIFIRCNKELMERIYDNAYKCGVTLNKKHKDLFNGYGIRLGTQEIARYDWGDDSLDKIAKIILMLTDKDIDVDAVKLIIDKLPAKKIKYAFDENVYSKFKELVEF